MDNEIDEKADRQFISFDELVVRKYNIEKEMSNFYKETSIA